MALRVILLAIFLSSTNGFSDAVTATPSLSSSVQDPSNTTGPLSTPPTISKPNATSEAALNAASSPFSTDQLMIPISSTSLAGSVTGTAKTPLPSNTFITATPNTVDTVFPSTSFITATPNTVDTVFPSTSAMSQALGRTVTEIPSSSSVSLAPGVDTTPFRPASSTAFTLDPTTKPAPASSSFPINHPSPSKMQLPTTSKVPSASASAIVTPTPTQPDNCNKVICGNSLEYCVDNGTHARCECMSAYYRATGSSLCQRDCETSYCYRKGKCERGPNGRVCRCVSPYSGVRCENERDFSIQVTVGSSIMAVVLLVSLFFIVRNGMKHSEKKIEKHGWELDLEAKSKAEQEEVAENRGEPQVKASSQFSKQGNDYDEVAESTAHHYDNANLIRSETADGCPPKYETIADINNCAAAKYPEAHENLAVKGVDIESKKNDVPDEIKAEHGTDNGATQADAPHAYANAAAEASVVDDEDAAEESAL